MIDRPLARSLVARFSGKLGYPKTTEGLAALIDAFEKAPDNATQAASVADDLQVETRYCPDVSEVWRAARALWGEKQIGCDDCDGTGWIQGTSCRRTWPLGDVVDYDTVKRCHCRRKAVA